MKLTKERMYEITSLPKKHLWARRERKIKPLVGATIPFAILSTDYSQVVIQKRNSAKRPFLSRLLLDMNAVTFRPLNQKDQAAIENAHGS